MKNLIHRIAKLAHQLGTIVATMQDTYPQLVAEIRMPNPHKRLQRKKKSVYCRISSIGYVFFPTTPYANTVF